VSGASALQELAEKVSRLCSEHRRLRKRLHELEQRVEKLSGARGKESSPRSRVHKDGRLESGTDSRQDLELIKSKVEEMLAELSDIG
jgi:phage shock protein A